MIQGGTLLHIRNRGTTNSFNHSDYHTSFKNVMRIEDENCRTEKHSKNVEQSFCIVNIGTKNQSSMHVANIHHLLYRSPEQYESNANPYVLFI